MTANGRDHIREIEAAIRGDGGAPEHGTTLRDEQVRASWRRCIETHRLDPGKGHDVHILPQARLREHQEGTEKMIRTSRLALENLYRLIGGQGYILVLADAAGVAVDYLGDPTFENQLRKAGLFLGAEWSEAHAGTCGVGSCIVTGEALTIHQDDHFDVKHTPLTCTAAPIYNPSGEISAVLDISALRSPEMKVSQQLFFHMLTSTARRIELANLTASTRSEWILRFSRAPEFLDVDPEGAVALDGSGRILGATHTGHKLLAASVGLHWRDLGNVIGRRMSDYLDFDVNDLPSFAGAAPPEDRLIMGRSGNAVFGHAVGPRADVPARRARAATAAVASLAGGAPAQAGRLHPVAQLAPTKVSIFIQGETGTGKERLARAIHDASRAAGRFVAVNCAALPDSLVEGELFGYAPGAFTGASSKGRKGLIAEADGGTLFLDEIGDMPFALQARLLRVLSEGEVVPLGSARPMRVDVRVVAATHQDLPALVGRREFREDLYHRIAGAVFTLPPLRQRADFDWIVDRLLHEMDRPHLPLANGARAALRRHRWPGNIRELKNALTLAAAVAEGSSIDLGDLPVALTGMPATPPPAAAPVPLGCLPGDAADHGDPAVASHERAQLRTMLDQHGWNVSAVARVLDVARSTIHRRIRRLAVVSPTRQPA